MNVPTFDDVTSAVNKRVRKAIPWLPSFECKACGAICETSWTYDADQAAFAAEDYGRNGKVPSWQCPNEECGKAWRREPSPLTTDIWNQ